MHDRFSQSFGLLLLRKKHGASEFILTLTLAKLIIVSGPSLFKNIFTFFNYIFSLFYYQLHPGSCRDALVCHCCRGPGLMTMFVLIVMHTGSLCTEGCDEF